MLKLPLSIFVSKNNKISLEYGLYGGTKYILAIGHPPIDIHKSEIEEIQYVGKYEFTITYQNVHTGEDLDLELLKDFLNKLIINIK